MSSLPKPTVLHLIDSLGRSGGAEQQLVANLSHFRSSTFEHEVLCLYRAAGGREGELPAGTALTYLCEGGHRVKGRVRIIFLTWRHLKRLAPDLIHCTLADASLAGRIGGRLLGIPVVESLVNISHEDLRALDNSGVAPWKLRLHRMVDRITTRKVARFHALSEEVARSWVRTVGLDPKQIEMIPRGVEVPHLDRSHSRRKLEQELGLDHDSYVMLNVGRQVAQKGQIYAVEALAQIKSRIKGAVLVSAGSAGPMTSRLQSTAERLGVANRIHWLGVRTDVPELLASADVFVFPSLFEGLGVSLLQAMAAALPCVTSDLPPMSEVISDGETGLLVPARDSRAIAAAIEALHRDPELAARLGAAARDRAAADFDSGKVAARTEALYQEVLMKSGNQ